MAFASVCGIRLEYAWFGPPSDEAPIVMLHEGLGSVAMWKNFPDRLAEASGRRVFAYSRQGYGRSDPVTQPREPRYMHREALEILPALLGQLGIVRPVLFGHSDGASIALIFAGAGAWPVEALVLLAPHVFVEAIAIETISQAPAAYRQTEMGPKLARYHDDPDGAFWGWNRIWLSPAFADWNIEHYVDGIGCPVLLVQGTGDEYGTLAQIDRIVRRKADAKVLVLDECGHSPHRDRPEALLAAVPAFLGDIVHSGVAHDR